MVDEIQEPTVEDQIKNIVFQLIWMQSQMHQFKRQFSKSEIKKIVDEVYNEECHRLETLRDDTVQVLRLLVDKGIMSQKELNEVLQK